MINLKKESRLAAGVILTAGFLYTFCMGTYASSFGTSVSGGVSLQGMDLEGMSADEVLSAGEAKTDEYGAVPVTMTIGEAQVDTTLQELGLYWNNKEVVDEIMLLGTTGNIIERYKEQKDLQNENQSFAMTFALDEETVRSYMEGCTVYNTEPEDAWIYTSDELTPAVGGGKKGISLNVDEASALMMDQMAYWEPGTAISVDLPVEETDPEVTYEELSKISDVLGKAVTDYSGSDYGRLVNVENGCEKITGTLLQPGEYFSVTDAVTPFTPENGYELAGAYEENQVVSAYGGGICQVSTTLYNAVLKAELEVVSRSNHTMTVGYVDLSKDAAIAEGVMDMAFVNNLEDPVYIIGYCDGWNITFWIYGHETRPANRTLEFVSETTAVIEPSGTRLVADPGQAVGYIDQTQSPHTGYQAELWKYVYYDGVLTDTIQVNSSYYNAVGTIYNIGVASSNPAQSQAMYAAIASNDLNQVYAVINGAYTAQTETQAQSETQAATDAAVVDPSLTVDPAYTTDPYTDGSASGETWVDTPDGETVVY